MRNWVHKPILRSRCRVVAVILLKFKVFGVLKDFKDVKDFKAC